MGVKIQFITLLKFIFLQPHKYIIQAEVLKDSWPLSEASWAFVQMLKELEKNELKGMIMFFSVENYIIQRIAPRLLEPCQEKTCFCHMRTTKAQISLRIRAV